MSEAETCHMEIECSEKGLLIENHSKSHFLIVYEVPEPPKRKFRKILAIGPNEFRIFDIRYEKYKQENFFYQFEKVIRTP